MSSHWLRFQDMRFPLRLGETLLGRSPYCSIVVNDGLVSRQHAAIRVTRDGMQIEDLGSRNGTFVNRRRISGTHVLSPGDRIDIGGHPMEIELESREDRPHRETLAVTGEYQPPPPPDLDDTLDTLTEPGPMPVFSKTARR
jgi:pSer/pThr/pTyr-binding forkhead associated (FHA) protein